MYLKQNTTICFLHAISPVHAGAGSATGAVDLPIQRERYTGWPHIQASGVKGAFRDHCERVWLYRGRENEILGSNDKEDKAKELANRIFGQADANSAQAGAVAFSDARLLAFPVRSNIAPFVWVVCPALLKRFARDLDLTGSSHAALYEASVAEDSYVTLAGKIEGEVVLEDICLKRASENADEKLVSFFQQYLPDLERLILVPDDHFSFLVQTATEVQAQIRIEPETGTTKDGSLRYQELLPADVVLYTVVFFGDERAEREKPLVMDTIRNAVKEAVATHIQMGGDMTLGRGIFVVQWLEDIEEGKGGAV